MTASDARLPVHEELTIRTHETLYKNEKWWKAIAVTEGFNQTQIGVYLWKRDDDRWTRKQKLNIADADEWERVREAVSCLLDELDD